MRFPGAALSAACTLGTLVASDSLRAQVATPPEAARHSMWLVYSGDHPVSGRFGLVFDSHMRLTADGDQQRQLLVRPGVSFALSDRVKLSAGYALMGARDD